MAVSPNPHPYATGQLAAAMRRAVEAIRETDRARAEEKVRRWQDVLAGTLSGQLTVGSRTPVVDTPAWVTLEVAHGGFATGRYLAEAPLDDAERATLAALGDDVPGHTDRERLNRWYLGDAGQAELLAALRTGRYRVDVPEEAALAVVVLLLWHGHADRALDLLAELTPFLSRLRFTPRFTAAALATGGAVRLASVGQVATRLAGVRMPEQVAAMRTTLGVWHPLHDRLVELWCSTVDGEQPALDADGAVRGGWPCRRWPADWAARRAAWLADYDAAVARHGASGRHAHRKSNFARLRRALLACQDGSDALSGRDVGWIRRALANTLSRHGAPGSTAHAEVRAQQRTVLRAPTRADLAGLLTRRLAGYPQDQGLPALEPVSAAATETEVSTRDSTAEIPPGTPIPESLRRLLLRALEAPVDELVRRGVLHSSEQIAQVLPQLTARIVAAGIADPVLAGLYERTYTAFRRRRGLLLLNLEHQVQLTELPWIAALEPFRESTVDNAAAAYRTLRQVVMLVLTAFPQTQMPNPLITELHALARRAGLSVPLVEEVAADIFMGTFTAKWDSAAALTAQALAGTPYAAYYDLPAPGEPPRRSRWGRRIAEKFSDACARRSAEVREEESTDFVAANGTVLEQALILTSHNLAPLVLALELSGELAAAAPELAERTLRWVVHHLATPQPDRHAESVGLKNAAYAWRQAIFLLSYCSPEQRAAALAGLRAEVRQAGLGRFDPAVRGLAHVLDGGRFDVAGRTPDGTGRRFLGWSTGPHWCLAPHTTPARP